MENNNQYVLEVHVRIRNSNYSGGALELNESRDMKIKTLSDAAAFLVKLHDLFTVATKNTEDHA